MKAEVITHIPCIVKVLAIENPHALTGLSRPDAAVGFYVIRRRVGDVFEINNWEEFSPRWMEFVEPDKLPTGWAENIEQREAARADRIREAAEQEAKKPHELQAEWLKATVEQAVATTLSQQQGLHGTAIPSHEWQQGKRRPNKTVE